MKTFTLKVTGKNLERFAFNFDEYNTNWTLKSAKRWVCSYPIYVEKRQWAYPIGFPSSFSFSELGLLVLAQIGRVTSVVNFVICGVRCFLLHLWCLN